VAHPGNGEARPSLEYSAILQDIPTKGLLDHIRYLVQVGDFVRVQSIRAAFEAREDRYRYAAAFERTLVQLAFAERKDLDARLARICRLAEEADTKISCDGHLTRGGVSPGLSLLTILTAQEHLQHG